MPHIKTDDGVNLWVEEHGSGAPVVFAHEFGGDIRSWEPQLRHFARNYRTIAFNARGYPPSDVPEDVSMYGQFRAVDDILAVLDGLGIDKAHIVGLSMGGFAALHFGFRYPDRALSLTVAGAGYGAHPDVHAQFADETKEVASRIEADTMAEFSKIYAIGPTRVQYANKDPRGWEAFSKELADHSTKGSANTMRAVQGGRPSLYDFVEEMQALTVPTLIMNGDEDDPCLDVGVFMKRNIPSSALVLLPRSGHLINLEEPGLFNQSLGDFLTRVDAGRWEMRDPRSMTTDILWTPDK
ncbi:MAG: alpha/beta hydrolase [Rhodospirillaceae bacterium]|jgi:pimeloyl-ACP methyl ester carboxylesterase|nr:alpha/beta hydrolase [Rhodospirillaceae bacterium]MBT5945938.1 alpha/beta hydrolase [Rhodospirillaceae bacterium]MBT6404544.1 alpha/beta hydrolase [Rhodospirillaceae bacterium]MBT6535711.1 alpha/beta hydrolase [Rhodospirillaceae bacterium]